MAVEKQVLYQGFMLADWRVEPLKGHLTGPDGSRHHVAPKAMEVLVCLAQHPGATVERSTLLSEVWGDTVQSHEALTHCVSELRHALADSPADPDFLQTLPRQGYRLIAPVSLQNPHVRDSESEGNGPRDDFFTRQIRDLRARKVFRTLVGYPVLAWLLLQVVDVLWEYFLQPLGTPEWLVPTFVILLALGYPIAVFLSWALDLTADGIRLAEESARDRYGGLLIVGAPALLLTGVALFVYFNALETGTPIEQREDYDSIRWPPVEKSIAVLRFLNISDNPAINYLSDGLTEELIHELTNLKTIKVAARTSVWPIAELNMQAVEIAERLSVEKVLEGSVRTDGDRIRVTAQLIDHSGFHIWSQTYDRQLDDILTIQKDIAEKVVDELDLLLVGDTKERLAKVPTVSSAAYDHYLQGRQSLRQPSTIETLREAGAHFEAAIDIDNRFPLAYAGLCETDLARYRLTGNTSHFADAEIACHRALTLDGGLAEVFTALGNLYRHSGQYDKAEQEFFAALRINPTLEEANYGLGRAYQAQGKISQAEEVLRRSIELEPGYWGTYFAYGNFLHQQGQYREAVPYYKTVTEMAPDYAGGFINLGSALHWLGDWSEAEEAWRRSVELDQDSLAYQNLGSLYYYRHEFRDAVEMHRRATELTPMDHRAWGKLAAAQRYLPAEKESSRSSYRKAIELVESELAINPDDAEDLYYLAAYLVNTDDIDAASRAIERALALAPENPSTHYFSAIVEIRRDDKQKALAELATATKLGYSYKMLAADPEFSRLREDPEFLMLEPDKE